MLGRREPSLDALAKRFGRFQDESMIRIATLHRQLRLVCASYAPIPNFPPLIQVQLAAHLGAPATSS
jgi:hypothetical protein